MRRRSSIAVFALLAILALGSFACRPPEPTAAARRDLVVSLRAEPRTFNPAAAVDNYSLAIIRRTTADLAHINRQTFETEPALAESWSVSEDGRTYTLNLRRGVRFSDGEPFDADDVLFSFRAYLDEQVNYSGRELLSVGGEPIRVEKLDSHTVRFELAVPYAVGDRLFDSFAILPQHLLEPAYVEGTLAEAWSIDTPPAEMAGLGPYRLREIVPGERVVLEANPHYWKVDEGGQRLPYLQELVFLLAASEDSEVIRFQSGEIDLIDGLNPQNFAVLERDAAERGYRLYDAGASLQFSFLFFNQNDLSGRGLTELEAKQAWFRDLGFRQAVSAAIDRDAIVKLAYQGRATPLASHVTPGNTVWANPAIGRPQRSLEKARALLAASGFRWNEEGRLLDRSGRPVEFSIALSSGNPRRMQMATIIQADLDEVGIRAAIAPLEFRALLDRVFNTYDYNAAVLRLAAGDVDPNPEINIWSSDGAQHLWRLGQEEPATEWEAEIDRLLQAQLEEMDFEKRREIYWRIQAIAAEQLPLIPLVSPNVLVGVREGLENFEPAILDHHTLWNVERLRWADG